MDENLNNSPDELESSKSPAKNKFYDFITNQLVEYIVEVVDHPLVDEYDRAQLQQDQIVVYELNAENT